MTQAPNTLDKYATKISPSGHSTDPQICACPEPDKLFLVLSSTDTPVPALQLAKESVKKTRTVEQNYLLKLSIMQQCDRVDHLPLRQDIW